MAYLIVIVAFSFRKANLRCCEELQLYLKDCIKIIGANQSLLKIKKRGNQNDNRIICLELL